MAGPQPLMMIYAKINIQKVNYPAWAVHFDPTNSGLECHVIRCFSFRVFILAHMKLGCSINRNSAFIEQDLFFLEGFFWALDLKIQTNFRFKENKRMIHTLLMQGSSRYALTLRLEWRAKTRIIFVANNRYLLPKLGDDTKS